MNGTPTVQVHGCPKSLSALAADVRSARRRVLAQRSTPVNREQLVLAQGSLLQALQDYACELDAWGLPVPRRLRDDLRLQSAIRGHQR